MEFAFEVKILDINFFFNFHSSFVNSSINSYYHKNLMFVGLRKDPIWNDHVEDILKSICKIVFKCFQMLTISQNDVCFDWGKLFKLTELSSTAIMFSLCLDSFHCLRSCVEFAFDPERPPVGAAAPVGNHCTTRSGHKWIAIKLLPAF